MRRLVLGWLVVSSVSAFAQPLETREPGWLQSERAIEALTEPACSYISTEFRKGLIDFEAPALAWIRGTHNGGAFPLEYFISGPRVINDTYGLFFYDPEGGYVSAFTKDYGYSFHGWYGGVMTVKGPKGNIWSALSGRAIQGPDKGSKLQRIPSVTTEWGYWLMLHPESTAYDLYSGNRYPRVPLPDSVSDGGETTRGALDARLGAEDWVVGVELGEDRRAYPIPASPERIVINDAFNGEPLAVFAYQPTGSATAFSRRVGSRTLTFYADEISPESAPFKDKETGTRWTIAGRAVDGPLQGEMLEWVDSIRCRWFAWSHEYPETSIF